MGFRNFQASQVSPQLVVHTGYFSLGILSKALYNIVDTDSYSHIYLQHPGNTTDISISIMSVLYATYSNTFININKTHTTQQMHIVTALHHLSHFGKDFLPSNTENTGLFSHCKTSTTTAIHITVYFHIVVGTSA